MLHAEKRGKKSMYDLDRVEMEDLEEQRRRKYQDYVEG